MIIETKVNLRENIMLILQRGLIYSTKRKKQISISSEYNQESLVDLTFENDHPSVINPWKRLVDIVGGLLGLVITGIIFIPLAILIKLDSKGPILYSQTRCGLNGRKFTIWKFRSMTVDADQKKHLVKNVAKGHIFKNPNDPRITRVGKFLRTTSVDEFPQFWNVLIGDMSLVGTRPPTPNEVENYDKYHLLRMKVKPGLTGEWQVRGRSLCLNFNDIVKMDIDYQHKWSVGYDLYLILKTFGVVIKREGAM